MQYGYRAKVWVTCPRAVVTKTSVKGSVKLYRKGDISLRLYIKAGTAYLGATSTAYSSKVK